MKNTFYFFTSIQILLLSLLFAPNKLAAQTQWVLEKDKNDIQIFTRKLPNASIKDYRAETVLNASAEEVLSFLIDFDNYKNWFANAEKCYLVKKVSNTELIQYFEAKAPWPVSNRDCVTRFEIDKKPNGDVRINLSLAPEFYEEKSDIVHISEFKGYWEITKIGENKVKIVQEVASNPGGAIPDWLANAFIIDTPFESFSKLKKRF